MNIKEYMQRLGVQARKASTVIAAAKAGDKNNALETIAGQIGDSRKSLLMANEQDLKQGREQNLDSALLDRLELTDARINGMLEGLQQVASLADPVGAISQMSYKPSGIQVGKMRVPLGVIGIIYESRPNVTVEAAALCLKSGNAAILRGGSEAKHSNQAIAVCIQQGLIQAGLPEQVVQVLETTDRAAVGEMVTMSDYIDVIVPRGGKGLIERVSREATVTVIKHLDGNCHVYIDAAADTEMAVEVALNAKTQRYGTCNTTESLLIHQSRSTEILPVLAARYAEFGVELRVCEQAAKVLAQTKVTDLKYSLATEQDWYEEYLAPVLSIKVISGIDEAIAHINHYSSRHTESIITNDHVHAMRFLREVDSSSVMVNASTRFADGFEYGLGAEIGISTDKIHARGPVGLEGLTSEKFIVLGSGQVRT